MTTIEAKKRSQFTRRTKMRRGKVELGDVRLGPRGEVEMIIINPWRDNPTAPVALVSHLGGVLRLPDGLIQVTFVREVRTLGGPTEFEAAAHMIWSSEHRWMDAGEAFRWIKQRFQEGDFRNALPDDGGGRKPRTQ